MIYILNHLNGFKIEDVKVEFVHDMYSPYNNTWNKIEEIEKLHPSKKYDDNKIYYNPDGKCT